MIGTSVGRYRIIGKLGSGGMGAVWKAEDSLLGRTVALKLLSAALTDSEDERKRLIRGTQAASALDHPGIATIYDAGEADGRIFVACQVVDGQTLSEKLKNGVFSIPEACRLVRDAALALGHAHGLGVLHRDVTSRNLMVDSNDRLVIVDFGLALRFDHSHLTRTGSSLGTFGYLAPEVALGERGDHRADLYGLGAILYELLTGRLPFQAERLEAFLFKTVYEEPVAPSRHQADIPPEVDRIILKLLAKKPENRYQAAAELAVDLDAFCPEPMRFPPTVAARIAESPSPAQPLNKSIRTTLRRLWLPLAIAMVALIAVSLTLLLRRDDAGSTNGSSHRIVAVLPFRNISADPAGTAFLADGICDQLATQLTHLSDLRVIPWLTSQRYSDVSSPQETAGELGVDALLTGTFRQAGNRIFLNMSLIDGKSGLMEWADDLELPADDPFEAQKRAALSVAARLRGRLSREREARLSEPPATNTDAYLSYLLGAHSMQAGHEDSAKVALRHFLRAVQLDSSMSRAYVGLGAVFSDRYFFSWEGGQSNLDRAEEYYRRALNLDPAAAGARRGLIRVAFERSQFEECLRLSREARPFIAEDPENRLAEAEGLTLGSLPEHGIPILEEVLKEDPASIAARWFLVMAYYGSAQTAKTVEAANEYLKRFPADAEILAYRGLAQGIEGDLEAARQSMEDAVDLFGENSNLYIYVELACIYERLGRPESTQKACDYVIEIAEPKLEAYPDHMRLRALLTAAHALRGNERETLRNLAALRAEILSTGHTPSTSYVVPWTLSHLGRNDLALEFLDDLSGRNLWSTNQSRSISLKCDIGLTSDPRYAAIDARIRSMHEDLASRY